MSALLLAPHTSEEVKSKVTKSRSEANNIKTASFVHHSMDSPSFQKNCEHSAEKTTFEVQRLAHHLVLNILVTVHCFVVLIVFILFIKVTLSLSHTHTHARTHARTHTHTIACTDIQVKKKKKKREKEREKKKVECLQLSPPHW